MSDKAQPQKTADKAAPATAAAKAEPTLSVNDRRGFNTMQLRLQDAADAFTSGSGAAQRKGMSGSDGDGRPVGMGGGTVQMSPSKVVQPKADKGGQASVKSLPGDLSSGIESMTGMSMDNVRVHHNSDAPAQLQAHAFAQGNDIHLAPGQEQHLPHEAWHVVQQRQGRVTPTRQLKQANINDDSSLEKEADVMGQKALQAGRGPEKEEVQRKKDESASPSGEVAQLWPWGNNGYEKIPEQEEEADNDREDDGAPLLGKGPRSDEYDEEAGPAAEDSGGSFSASAGEITYEDGVVTIPFLDDYALKIGSKGVSMGGSLPSSSFDMDLPKVDLGIDIPFAPGVYATASLAITPTFSLTVSGGEYAVSVGDAKSVSISGAGVTGEVGLEITAKGGVGAGLANVAGLEGGVFGTLGASAKMGGTIDGNMDFTNKAGGINLNILGEADILGKAGMFISAKFGFFSFTKTFPLAEKRFAHLHYSRSLSLGVDSEQNWKPTAEDFTKLEYGDKSSGMRLKTKDGKVYQELTDSFV